MRHRHGQRPVRARVRVQPLVGELGVVRVIRRDHHDLLAFVAGLGHEVRVRRTRDRDVGTPHDQVRRVEPVRGLGHVRLVAEHLRRGHRQVRVPVVEREHRAAEQLDEAGAGAERGHRHGRDRGEAGDAVRTDRLGGVDVGGRRDLQRVLPPAADEPALAAGALVPGGFLRVLDDRPPGIHRVGVLIAGRAPQLEQAAADVRVAHPGGRVGVPGERGATRAAAGLVPGHVVADVRVVGLLRLPGDDPLLDIHLPRAGARAVDAVGGADHLVVAPAVAVEHVRLAAALEGDGAQVVGGLAAAEEPAGLEDGVRGRAVEFRRAVGSRAVLAGRGAG